MVLQHFRSALLINLAGKRWAGVPLLSIALGTLGAMAWSQEDRPSVDARVSSSATQSLPSVPSADAPPSADASPRLPERQTEPGLPQTGEMPRESSEPKDSRIFTLEPKHVSAIEFGRVLERLLSQPDVKMVPDERTNRLLIVSAPMTNRELEQLNHRLYALQELIDVEATQPETVTPQPGADMLSWEKLVRDLEAREQALQQQLSSLPRPYSSDDELNGSDNIQALKRMEFDVQLARIQRMRAQLTLMEAQLYENAGIQRATTDPNVTRGLSMPFAPPVPPVVAPHLPMVDATATGTAPAEPVAPTPPNGLTPPTPTAPVPPATTTYAPAMDSGWSSPGANTYPPRYGFNPGSSLGTTMELLKLRETVPGIDLTPIYDESLERLEAQLEGLIRQGEAIDKMLMVVQEKVKAGTATELELAKIHADAVPLGVAMKELQVQIKSLKLNRDKILGAKDSAPPVEVSR